MNVTTLLIIVSVFAALSIIVLVLMQQGKGDMGSAFGGGGSQSMFGSRGSANFLSRTTSVMTTVLFLSCLALAYLYAKRNAELDVIDTVLMEPSSEVPAIEGAAGDASEIPTIPVDVDTAETGSSDEIPSIPGNDQPAADENPETGSPETP